MVERHGRLELAGVSPLPVGRRKLAAEARGDEEDEERTLQPLQKSERISESSIATPRWPLTHHIHPFLIPLRQLSAAGLDNLKQLLVARRLHPHAGPELVKDVAEDQALFYVSGEGGRERQRVPKTLRVRKKDQHSDAPIGGRFGELGGFEDVELLANDVRGYVVEAMQTAAVRVAAKRGERS